jgi:CRISPR-associated protein Csb1
MNALFDKFESWFKDEGPSALIIREHLMPVEGNDGVLFPPTFAASENKTKGGYNIDNFSGGKNVCLIDTVGSQANRIEPLFVKPEYAALVPQITVTAGEKKVNLLDAGHRAGDAVIRCSELRDSLEQAFLSLQKGNAAPLAKIAPTSLVFGVWDSRDTQVKAPRLIASTIRAYDVHPLTRSAQYIPAVDYIKEELLPDREDLRDKDGNPIVVSSEHPYAKRGFVHVPATGTHGGVIATSGIRRDATLHLAALRLLKAGEDVEATLSLQRYLLGLALTAFTYPSAGYLRQGCNLVADPEKPREYVEVYGDGRRLPLSLTHSQALEYARKAATVFGVGESREVLFKKDYAQEDLKKAEKKKTKSRKQTKKDPK